LEQEGLTERDVFAKALSILGDVYNSKRVGRIAKGQEDSAAVEFLYGINVSPDESHAVAKDQTTSKSRGGMLRIGKNPEAAEKGEPRFLTKAEMIEYGYIPRPTEE